jgi:predicted PurR-regulated permease PerM
MLKNLTLDKVIKSILGAAGLLLVGIILYNYSNLVAYAVIAMFFSYMLDPVVDRLQAAGMNRTLGTTLTLATLILIIVWGSTSVIPIVVNQMVGLTNQLNIENLRFIAEQIEVSVINTFEFVPEGFLRDNISVMSNNLFDVGQISNLLSDMIGIFTNLFAAFLVIPFATFFFS